MRQTPSAKFIKKVKASPANAMSYRVPSWQSEGLFKTSQETKRAMHHAPWNSVGPNARMGISSLQTRTL